MIKAKVKAALFLLFLLVSASAEAKLYKWVDENGETHYGSVLPPEYASQEKKQLDDQGREIKAKEVKKKVEAVDPAILEQQREQERHDKALLGSFSSPEEIDLARDRNLQQINARTNSFHLRLKTAREDLANYKKEQDSLKEPDKNLESRIKQTNNRIKGLEDELGKVKDEANKIRERYDADKKRYIELTAEPK